MESFAESFNESHKTDVWDEAILIKSYNDCIKVVSEDVAKYVARSTNSNSTKVVVSNDIYDVIVDDFVRATYEKDGCDYEAKILTVDKGSRTCLLKFIGYDNEQRVDLKNLIPSWGKKARRIQFDQAKITTSKHAEGKINIGHNKEIRPKCIPPPPPIPPMLTKNVEDTEHLSAMLMSWYMSGYYTGIYEGMKIVNA